MVSDASAWRDGQVGARDAGEADLAEAGSTENGGSTVDVAAGENTTDSAVDGGAGETRDAGSALFEALVLATPVGVAALNGDQRLLDGGDFRIDDTAIVGLTCTLATVFCTQSMAYSEPTLWPAADAGVTDASDND